MRGAIDIECRVVEHAGNTKRIILIHWQFREVGKRWENGCFSQALGLDYKADEVLGALVGILDDCTKVIQNRLAKGLSWKGL